MSIEYKYTIAAVDENARCMEIIFEADGHPTQHIGARLPYEGEALEDIVRMFAPVRYWEELKAVVSPPQVGSTGVIKPIVEVAVATLAEPGAGTIPGSAT